MNHHIFPPIPFPGVADHQLTARFRTFADLTTALTGTAAGTTALLFGPTGVIGRFTTDGADNFSLAGVLDFTACDGSEFVLGTTGAADIEGLDGVAPTLSAAGLDVSLVEGRVRFNFLSLSGHANNSMALLTVAVPTPADGLVVGIGIRDLYGCTVYNLANTTFLRAGFRGDPPVNLSGYNAARAVPTPAGDTLVSTATLATNVAGSTATVCMGAWDAADTAGATLQGAATAYGLTSWAGSSKVHILSVGLAAVGFSAVVTKLTATGGLA